jgi:acyl-homoserine-lactone acylase
VSVDVRQADGSLSTVSRTFASTPLGPVVHESPGRIFVVRSQVLESWRHYEGFFHLWRARSLQEFERVLDRRLLNTSNFTYADTDGNVLYRWNALLPKRPDASADYELDVDPSDRRRRWKGLHEARELPRLLNPAGGYIQNANNAPGWTTLGQRLDPGRYPPYVERGPLALRPQVILGHLEARERWSPEDVLAAKYDTRVLLAERVLPDLLAAAAGVAAPSADLREAIEVLGRWDRRVSADSRGAVLFQRFWELYREGRERPFAEDWTEARPLETPRGLADAAAAVDRLEAAARDVRARHGSLAVAWGDVHRFRFGDLDLPGDGAPGNPLGLYRVQGFDPQPGGSRVAGHLGTPLDAPQSPMAGTGDAWILLVQLSRPVRAWSLVAYGQASDLSSPHSRDQIRTFVEHGVRPVWFTRAEIAANAERTYRPGQ